MSTNGSRLTYKPLALVPDANDWALHKRNCSAELVTRRLRELVPLLETVDCVVEEMGLVHGEYRFSVLKPA